MLQVTNNDVNGEMFRLHTTYAVDQNYKFSKAKQTTKTIFIYFVLTKSLNGLRRAKKFLFSFVFTFFFK